MTINNEYHSNLHDKSTPAVIIRVQLWHIDIFFLSEDECKYLDHMDGDRHYVPLQKERTVDDLDLEILLSRYGGFSFSYR